MRALVPMKVLVAIATFCLVLVMSAAKINAASLAPDLVIVNAAIHTMDEAQPKAQALAVSGNRIAAVGSTGNIRSLAGPKARVIDAGGKNVFPGFNDAHVHFLTGGYSLSSVDLRDAKSPEEMARRLREYAKTVPKGRWILGGDWDHEKWPGAPLPTKEMIDATTPEHPVFNAPDFLRASQDRFFLCIFAADPQFDPGNTRDFLQAMSPVGVSEIEE